MSTFRVSISTNSFQSSSSLNFEFHISVTLRNPRTQFTKRCSRVDACVVFNHDFVCLSVWIDYRVQGSVTHRWAVRSPVYTVVLSEAYYLSIIIVKLASRSARGCKVVGGQHPGRGYRRQKSRLNGISIETGRSLIINNLISPRDGLLPSLENIITPVGLLFLFILQLYFIGNGVSIFFFTFFF